MQDVAAALLLDDDIQNIHQGSVLALLLSVWPVLLDERAAGAGVLGRTLGAGRTDDTDGRDTETDARPPPPPPPLA